MMHLCSGDIPMISVNCGGAGFHTHSVASTDRAGQYQKAIGASRSTGTAAELV
jgi:hypothetical protein